MVILTDPTTASAAEILASCLQDHGRALIVGERTFGKGTVETIKGLPNGGALKLSISEFFRPSGNSLRKPEDEAAAAADPNWGVIPDEYVAAGPVDRDLDARGRFDRDPVWKKALEHLGKELAK